MDKRAALALLALVFGCGVGLGWLLAPGSGQAEAPLPAARDEGDTPPPPLPRLGSDASLLDTVTRKLAEETRRRETAEAELEEARAKLTELADGEPTPTAAVPASGVRFEYEGFGATLSQIDWRVAGQALSRMNPLLGELATALREGKPVPPSVGDIQKHNGALVKLALTAQQQGMPGTGTNGAFTHPSILVNLVYSTLREAGDPLDAGQEARLAALGEEAVNADARRLAGYGPETLALRKVLDETALKDRFYAGVDALVTDSQREILHPAPLRGRLGFDLFSSGLVWMGVVAPQRHATVDDLRGRLGGQLRSRFGIQDEQRAVVEDVVAEWLAGFPAGYLDAGSDALEQGGRLQVDRVRVAAEVQLRALRTLMERLPAGSPAIEQIRAEPTVAVPVRTP